MKKLAVIEALFVAFQAEYFKPKKRTAIIEAMERKDVIIAEANALADDLERDGFPPRCVQCWRTLRFDCTEEGKGGECDLTGRSSIG